MSGKHRWRNPSGYSRIITRVTNIPGDYIVTSSFDKSIQRRKQTVLGDVGGTAGLAGVLPDSIDSYNLGNRLATELLGQLQNGNVDAGSNIIQSGQTAREVASIASDVATAYRGFRTDNLGLIKKALIGDGSATSAIHRRYLQWIYGIKPTMSDCYNSMKLLQRHLVESHIFSVSSSGTISDSYHYHSQNDRTNLTLARSEHMNIHHKAYCAISSSTLLTIASWGVLNPLSVAWEVLPYTFVIDWLVPVGSVLSALTAPLGYEFKGGNIWQYHECQYVIEQMDDTQTVITGPSEGTPSKAIANSTRYVRDILTHFPLPGLYIKSPFSSTHIANAIALIGSLKR